MKRPRVLVTLDVGESLRRGVPFPNVNMKSAYARAIEAAGGLPILAAPTEDRSVIAELAELMDGLVITGGAFDIDPVHYGEAPTHRIDTPKPVRTAFEWALLQSALARDVPVLGICGGMQLLNVVLGGTLIQDISSTWPEALDHEQPTSPAKPHHVVRLVEDTELARILPSLEIEVNSTHHQAVRDLGAGLEILGASPDGVVEAIGHARDLRVLGVQWHPELLDDEVSRALYGALVAQCHTR